MSEIEKYGFEEEKELEDQSEETTQIESSEEEKKENDLPEEEYPVIPKSRQLAMLEAILFAASEPLTEADIAKTLPGLIEANVIDLVNQLEESYEERGLTVQRVAGGWRLATRAEFADILRTHLRGKIRTRLSKASLDTVSIIAYRQPVSRSEIEQMRGVDSSQVLRHLLERDLITITGRAEAPGRPLLYGTSKQFLEYFGLESLHGLPKPEEIFGEPEEEQAGQAVPVQRGPFEGADSGVEEETYRPDYSSPLIVQKGDWSESDESEEIE